MSEAEKHNKWHSPRGNPTTLTDQDKEDIVTAYMYGVSVKILCATYHIGYARLQVILKGSPHPHSIREGE